jgi:CheY-like chemotaxis protein
MMRLDSTILLAEDDDNDVFLLQHAFESAGIRNPIAVVRDGQQAIEYLTSQGEYSDVNRNPLPSLFILDLKMPRRNGMDVLGWLRQQPGLGCVPTIVFSSSAHRKDIERAYRLGANAFVVKPSSNERRIQFAMHLKGFWLAFNEPPIMCTEGLEAALEIDAEEKVPVKI